MSRQRMSPNPGDLYPKMIREFLDVELVIEEHGAFPAVEGELVGEGVLRPKGTTLVHVSRVLVEQHKTPGTRFAPLPYLWFLPGIEESGWEGFVVDVELVLEALEKAMEGNRLVVPCWVAEEPEGDLIEAAAPRYLTISTVELQRPSAGEAMARRGIRFEISEEDHRPLYSFTMAGLTPFLAIGAAVLREVTHVSRGSSFSQELDQLGEEIEAGAEAFERGPEAMG